MNRRQLLATMGLAGGGALLLPRRAVLAGEAPAPLRFVVMYTAQGCVPDRWRCEPGRRGTWQADWTTWSEADFSETLRPLYRWRHRTTAVGGLGLASTEAEYRDTQHKLAIAHGLTGAMARWESGIPLGGGASIDQIVADHIAREDRWRSIECAVDGGMRYQGVESAVYREALQPITPIHEPADLWARLFQSAPEGTADRRLQGQVLGAVGSQYEALGAGLVGPGAEQLEVHRALLGDLRTRLEGLGSASCGAAPEVPSGVGVDHEQGLAEHVRLITAAFACDLARVASIQIGTDIDVPGQADVGARHPYAHDIYNDVAAADVMVGYQAYLAERFCTILDALDAVPEGAGSMLDNTVVVWLSELADAWHGNNHWPVVIAGGRNTRLRAGRYVTYASTTPIRSQGPGGGPTIGVPHQRLLVSLAQLLGLPVEEVGERWLRGEDGSTIDCTGALPELLA